MNLQFCIYLSFWKIKNADSFVTFFKNMLVPYDKNLEMFFALMVCFDSEYMWTLCLLTKLEDFHFHRGKLMVLWVACLMPQSSIFTDVLPVATFTIYGGRNQYNCKIGWGAAMKHQSNSGCVTIQEFCT
jgi:hypothetical protein